MRAGSSPVACAAKRPPTLQEAKPKAGSVLWQRAAGCGSQMGVKAQKSPPHADAQKPDENQSGRKHGGKDAWARLGRNVTPPIRGSKPAKGEKNP
jgi:hypothetical protein